MAQSVSWGGGGGSTNDPATAAIVQGLSSTVSALIYRLAQVESSALKAILFTQMVPSKKWVVPHNLLRTPVVTVYDSSHQQVFGDVDTSSTTQVVISFSGAMAGTAILS